MGPQPKAVRTAELKPDEALKLLAGTAMGRVVFSHRALPTIRPVNHIVDDDHVVIRTHTGSALLGPAGTGAVVAYEADEIDPVTRTGWSVIVTGTVTLVHDPVQQARYRRLITPWADADMDQVVRISTDIVTGYRLISARG
jgi:nitroimidazol reductase NimA-like FMN-containing flavoprotein (pyridoxamine 5'-phosphate oxidase superfamily)